MAEPKLLDEYIKWPGEFAEQIGRSTRTVERWRRLGLAPPITVIGNLQVVHVEDGRAWLRKHRRVEEDRVA